MLNCTYVLTRDIYIISTVVCRILSAGLMCYMKRLMNNVLLLNLYPTIWNWLLSVANGFFSFVYSQTLYQEEFKEWNALCHILQQPLRSALFSPIIHPTVLAEHYQQDLGKTIKVLDHIKINSSFATCSNIFQA